MCGRFALLAPAELIAATFELITAPEPLPPRYNIAPTQPVLAIRPTAAGGRAAALFRWGLIPSWAKEISIGSRLINARAETVTEKPAFCAAYKRRRCLIPASGFYEWRKENGRKQPMYIHPQDDDLFAFAGLWETWEGADGSAIESCTILTTTPNTLMAPIHDRMPVIVEAADFDLWLLPEANSDRVQHLLRPYPAAKMAAYPVSATVNNPRNETPDCIIPLA